MTTRTAPALPLPITSLYAGLCGILYFSLTWAIIKRRRNMKIPYGFGEDRILRKRSTVILLLWVDSRTALARLCHLVQAHANASQYMPLLLIYIALLEAGGSTSTWLLHLYGLLTFLGRLAHAYTVALDGTPVIYRAYGMAMTAIPVLLCSVQLLWKAVQTMLQ